MLINSLGLKNFKCFEELDVKFAPITLLTGANSSGKSSLINAILAVLQTEGFPFYLSPNGKYVNMGSFEEMARWTTNSKKLDIEINIALNDSGTESGYSFFQTTWREDTKNNLPKLIEFKSAQLGCTWHVKKKKDSSYSFSCVIKDFFSSLQDDHSGDFIKREFENVKITPSEDYLLTNNISITNSKFESLEQLVEKIKTYLFEPSFRESGIKPSINYLGSFRLPPERTYYQKPKAADRVNVAGDGYIDQIIEWDETQPDTIKQLIDFMRELELVDSISANRMRGGRFELRIKTKNNSKDASLADIGFGVSQFLPIIVADLQLSDESLLAVSQPELHLHPKIQAAFANYLAKQINTTNKQYIIETHSEYLLNRIRLLLVTGELKPEDVCVLYFENDGMKSTNHNIEFATNGSVKGAPESFFDTYGIDVMNIAMEAIK
ncbi:DUF3696 domain-containing protein [uncultured Fibrella sp.]|uniref:AAA family ATPase n=1 Tax=uncultured Fibrella sp. TaxID=1284596 RepID=UPI0035CA94D6